MESYNWQHLVRQFDDRRDIVIPGDAEATIEFCVKQFLQIASDSIKNHSYFTVAVSGGSTPVAIFAKLSQQPYRDAIDWSKVIFFWSDERNVPKDSPESNYFSAMQSGVSKLPIPSKNVIRMVAEPEYDLEESARSYEKAIIHQMPDKQFDLMMLGMGDDGHTASLFPGTEALNSHGRLAVANFVPQKKCWRMTLTYECINASKHICIYILGKNKADMVFKALSDRNNNENLPIQRVGTSVHKALWILDADAASILQSAK